MFGSETVAEEVNVVLAGVAAVAAAVGTRIVPLSVLPPEFPSPAVLHHMDASTSSGPVGSDAAINSEVLRYAVRLVCEGWSTDPIRAAAEAMIVALNGHNAQRGADYLTFMATGEWPLTTVLDDGVPYRQLGAYFDVEITRGG